MAAALGSAWSAGQHLSALNNLATKLERLERQAELLDTLQQEEEGQVGAALTVLKGHCWGVQHTFIPPHMRRVLSV